MTTMIWTFAMTLLMAWMLTRMPAIRLMMLVVKLPYSRAKP